MELLYPNPLIPLNHTDAFTLLISVILSCQSTDKKVNEITPKLFSKANIPKKMVMLNIKGISKIIKPVGIYNKKAKNIYFLSKILIEKYNGKIPKNFKKLISLPGVGRKTALIIMSQFFGKYCFPVDRHIKRLMYFWNLSIGKNVLQIEKDAKKIFPKKLWNKIYLQIIYYGREYSPARGWCLKKDIITQLLIKKKLLKR